MFLMFSRIWYIILLKAFIIFVVDKNECIQAWMPVKMHQNERPLEESDNDKH